MKNKTTTAILFLVLAISAAVAPLGSAMAGRYEAVSRASGNLLTLSHQITQDTLLVALEVDKKQNLARLGAHAEILVSEVNALRGGDGATITWPTIVNAQLIQIEKLASDLLAIIRQGQGARAMSQEQVQTVVGLEALLREAVANFQNDYRNHSPSGEVYSLYLQTLDVARQQAVLSQKMFKEFLFVAYGLATTDNLRNLNRSYSMLDRSFQALIHGDSELRLIPAPNQTVERHWNEARDIWIGIRPIIKEAARTGAVDVGLINEIANRNDALLTAMVSAVEAY